MNSLPSVRTPSTSKSSSLILLARAVADSVLGIAGILASRFGNHFFPFDGPTHTASFCGLSIRGHWLSGLGHLPGDDRTTRHLSLHSSMTCRGMDLAPNVPTESRHKGPKTASGLFDASHQESRIEPAGRKCSPKKLLLTAGFAARRMRWVAQTISRMTIVMRSG
jgi:hypothetical protein